MFKLIMLSLLALTYQVKAMQEENLDEIVEVQIDSTKENYLLTEAVCTFVCNDCAKQKNPIENNFEFNALGSLTSFEDTLESYDQNETLTCSSCKKTISVCDLKKGQKQINQKKYFSSLAQVESGEATKYICHPQGTFCKVISKKYVIIPVFVGIGFLVFICAYFFWPTGCHKDYTGSVTCSTYPAPDDSTQILAPPGPRMFEQLLALGLRMLNQN